MKSKKSSTQKKRKVGIHTLLDRMERARNRNNANWMKIFRMLYAENPKLCGKYAGWYTAEAVEQAAERRERQNAKYTAMFRYLLLRRPKATKDILRRIVKQDKKVTALAGKICRRK